MRRIKIAGLCLVAVFAVSVAFAGTASAAAPEFGSCVKGTEHSESNYDSSKCIKLASEDTSLTEAERLKKGVYKWVPGFTAGKTGFTTVGGAGTLTAKGGKTVTCTSEKSTGNYLEDGTNKKESTTVEFAGCKSSGFACTTVGKATGELVTNPLLGEVGYENAAKKKTALKLWPETGTRFIEFKCVGLEVKVRGKEDEPKAGILVNIKNDAMKSTEILKYKQKLGVQKPVKWEGPNPTTYLESNFENLGWEQSGQEIESKVENEGGTKMELNAVV
jgi:hypothetical protein